MLKFAKSLVYVPEYPLYGYICVSIHVEVCSVNHITREDVPERVDDMLKNNFLQHLQHLIFYVLFSVEENVHNMKPVKIAQVAYIVHTLYICCGCTH